MATKPPRVLGRERRRIRVPPAAWCRALFSVSSQEQKQLRLDPGRVGSSRSSWRPLTGLCPRPTFGATMLPGTCPLSPPSPARSSLMSPSWLPILVCA